MISAFFLVKGKMHPLAYSNLNSLFKVFDKCFECSSNDIKQSDLFLEARLLLSRAGDAVRGGGNSLAKSGNLSENNFIRKLSC